MYIDLRGLWTQIFSGYKVVYNHHLESEKACVPVPKTLIIAVFRRRKSTPGA